MSFMSMGNGHGLRVGSSNRSNERSYFVSLHISLACSCHFGVSGQMIYEVFPHQEVEYDLAAWMGISLSQLRLVLSFIFATGFSAGLKHVPGVTGG
jgi:hypothetical protein